ncbi:uncharacterized protein [Palaemon carinicauda]|uniref:uncharacterized protein n=1 Tax=Palaemon carinicauda TaxID=392227 RepID=UPI0035B63EC1
MVDYGNFMPSYMRQSVYESVRILGEKLQFVPNDDYQQAFDMVNEGTAAFLEGTEYVRYMVIRFNAWNTYFLEEDLESGIVGWFFPKNTPWKYKFDRYLQMFVEGGLPTYYRNKLVDKYSREMNLTQAVEKEATRPLTISDLQVIVES